ncbi:MAG: hypothetical protein NW206_20465 [Hyphomonadaceae bacterium]|nr:hypothetical protein [Hyphomonadaceae bacterium]
MNTQSPKKSGHALPVLLLVVGMIVLVLVTQRAIFGATAGFVAGLWVSVMDVVFRLVASVFGG